jgi:hypothetical protein
VPLTRVDTLDGDARRPGGRFRTWTGIGPVGFWDPLTVTAWEERPDGSGRCRLRHTGRVVKGEAEITVEAVGDGLSRVTWTEWVDLGRAGALGWRVGAPLVRLGLRRVLATMASSLEQAR